MRTIIVGGGVAGAATALALRRNGAEVTVFEANPDPAGAVGSFLSLASNGLRGLESLGCLAAVRAVGFEVPRQRIWSSSGRLLGDMPRGRLSADPLNSVTLRRGDLVERLRDEAQRAGARLVTGRRMTGAEQTEAGVRVRFDDASAAEAELLIGADGIWSSTRRLLDPAMPEPQYAGLYSVSGVSDGAGLGLEAGVFNMVFGRRGVFVHLSAADGRVWWSAQVAAAQQPDDLATVDVPALLDLYRAEAVAGAVLRATTELQRPTLYHVLPAVRVWHTGRIVLAGDAAHPVGAGQGASMAIEDAVVLAARLAAAPTLQAGLADYVTARQARTAKMIKAATANRDAKTAGPIGRRVNDLMMPIFFRLFYEKATAWLYTEQP